MYIYVSNIIRSLKTVVELEKKIRIEPKSILKISVPKHTNVKIAYGKLRPLVISTM